MATNFAIPKFIFVIDTNKYAGNFERQLCAFITGCIGDCGVGEKEQTQFLKDMDQSISIFDQYIINCPDEHQCFRPVSIWDTPGRVNNGRGQIFNENELSEQDCYQNTKWKAYESVAIFFIKRPPKKLINIMILRARFFASLNDIIIKSFRTISYSVKESQKYLWISD